jgi:hypothetical protein
MLSFLLALSLTVQVDPEWLTCPTPQEIEDSTHSNLNWLSGDIQSLKNTKFFKLSPKGKVQALLVSRGKKDYIVVRDCDASRWIWYPTTYSKGAYRLGLPKSATGTAYSPY